MINKPTRVTKTTTSIIDNIITNNIIDNTKTKIQSGIIKTDLTDHFPVFLIINSATLENKVKTKTQSKKNYYSSLLNKTFGNARKTWNVIKEITGVGIVKSDNLPNRLQRDDNRGDAFVNKEIAETFNSFFINIGKKLAGAIPEGKKSFKFFLKKSDSFMEESELLIDELRLAISMLKTNKSAGLDEVNPDVVKAVSDIIEKPLFKIFNLSLKNGIFPDQLKLAKKIPIYKGGDDSIKSNYRPISILSCFSKILERIMHNRLKKYDKAKNLITDFEQLSTFVLIIIQTKLLEPINVVSKEMQDPREGLEKLFGKLSSLKPQLQVCDLANVLSKILRKVVIHVPNVVTFGLPLYIYFVYLTWKTDCNLLTRKFVNINLPIFQYLQALLDFPFTGTCVVTDFKKNLTDVNAVFMSLLISNDIADTESKLKYL
ncbi:uncharacterized protein LOC136074374 [Hydra vulgaris]|uniref:Uncharacterized protein LOC136074374 n=1 Tax=Hydra vulgaris TaxID=6087 RepID=A0ABM4B1T1_HYDVU